MESGLTFEDKELQILLSGFTLVQKQKVIPRSPRKKVIVIAGPTAIGKSQLAITIAKAVGGEVISADSMQVYRGMDIGTAKPGYLERGSVPHHLIDSRDLDETFNVVEYYHESAQAIKEIHDKGGVPIVAGGTGFYIHSMIYGPPAGPPSDASLRKELEQEMELHGPRFMYDRLMIQDPLYALSITPKDRHKIVRALEIIALTGGKVSELPPSSPDHADSYDFRCWFVYMPKESLYPRIEARCDRMVAEGFADEVKRLEKEGLRQNQTASMAIGYRQCLDYLSSAQTPAEWGKFLHGFKQASRRYARRQFTWFRREPLFRWLNIDKVPMENVAEIIIQDLEQSV